MRFRVVTALCALAVLAFAGCSRPSCDPRLAFKLDGRLIHGVGTDPEDSKVFLVVAGEKRWVTTWVWLTAHGYKGEDLVSVPHAELACFPDGAALP
ncbi:MAG: hypothetical protein M3169_00500 [Candidatus Eremiobacteraeota bacterium]|nr:hypothetical protein [Candidatus Eremiobacteraeota bacterium]